MEFTLRRNHPVGFDRAARWVVLAFALPAAAAAAVLSIEVEPRWGAVPLRVPSAEFADAGGQPLRVTRFSALLSGFALRRVDGSEVRLDGQFGLLDAGSGRLAVALRGVPEGTFTGLSFEVGLPPGINRGDPGRWPPGHALNPLVNRLHWSWQGGYVFAALEGLWRPKGAVEERGFLYHVATDAHRMPVGFRADFEVRDDRVIRLAWNLSRVFALRELRAGEAVESTHSGEGDPLAASIADALRRGWFWLGDAPAAERSASTEPLPASGEIAAAASPLAFTVPPGFPQPSLPADNPLTREAVALGWRLFRDPRLAGNGAQSCASCHDPDRAFSDRVALSRGAAGRFGKRNAMPLFNLAWASEFAWDGRQPRLRDQALAAWRNADEMGADPEVRAALLAADAELASLARAAFGPATKLDARLVTLALEQYLLTIVSSDSRFDRAMRGEAALTGEEQRGFELFMTEHDPLRGKKGADCFHCHGGALFSDFDFRNNGLGRSAADAGRGAFTGRPADRGRFKTPSLRNVALTAPYMHDGRLATLEEVVAHYDHGVRRGETLDPNLAKHPEAGMGLTAADQRALVAFLRTLTEERLPWRRTYDP